MFWQNLPLLVSFWKTIVVVRTSSGIFSDILRGKQLTFYLIFFLAYLLTFSPTYLLAFYLACSFPLFLDLEHAIYACRRSLELICVPLRLGQIWPQLGLCWAKTSWFWRHVVAKKMSNRTCLGWVWSMDPVFGCGWVISGHNLVYVGESWGKTSGFWRHVVGKKQVQPNLCGFDLIYGVALNFCLAISRLCGAIWSYYVAPSLGCLELT